MRLDMTGWKMTVSYTSAFSTPWATKLPSNVSLREVESDLTDNAVAAPRGVEQDGLAAIAAEARVQGIDLSIVVVEGNPAHDSELRDLATEVAKFQHGTVAVFSADWIGTTSDSISRVRLEWAEDKAKFKGGKSEEAAQIFVDRLTQPETVSWTAITSVLLAGLVLAVTGLYWVKRRRGPADPPADRPAGERRETVPR